MDLDLSLPLSTLLRLGTTEAHTQVEHTQGATWLARGELDKDEYVRFLMMLWHIYDTLEFALERHSACESLAPTYNPAVLARAASISADISYILQVPEASWKSHPIHMSMQANPPACMTAYVLRIQHLSDLHDPSPLLAHSYVRYLGDLSGGQHIRRAITKAYGLNDSEQRLGTQFYSFKQLAGPGTGTIGDLKKIKEWFRTGVDQGVPDNTSKKRVIVEEARRAFQLNTALFAALRAPSYLAIASPVITVSSDDGSKSLTKMHFNMLAESLPGFGPYLWFALTAVLTGVSTFVFLGA